MYCSFLVVVVVCCSPCLVLVLFDVVFDGCIWGLSWCVVRLSLFVVVCVFCCLWLLLCYVSFESSLVCCRVVFVLVFAVCCLMLFGV